MVEPVRESAFGLTATARAQTAAADAKLLESLAEQVGRHCRQLRRRVGAQRQQGTDAGHCPEAIMLDYLDRYRDQPFGHPLARDR